MEIKNKESRSLEAYCRGGQGPRRAVAPFGWMDSDMHNKVANGILHVVYDDLSNAFFTLEMTYSFMLQP
jgi:hypothetical protein